VPQQNERRFSGRFSARSFLQSVLHEGEALRLHLNSTTDPARYYTGITSNVRVRLAEHNRGGCLHTRRWTPCRVIVVVAFASGERALDFKRYLKTGSGCAFAARHFR